MPGYLSIAQGCHLVSKDLSVHRKNCIVVALPRFSFTLMCLCQLGLRKVVILKKVVILLMDPEKYTGIFFYLIRQILLELYCACCIQVIWDIHP